MDVRPGEISRQNSLVREGETSSGETSPAIDTSEEKGTGIVLSVEVYHIHERVRKSGKIVVVMDYSETPLIRTLRGP